ncbi:MAG TPA: HTTM domain-containing protein [Acidimicrobiia bacterium]|nr:HTTM domain-containing protein [Acidimicrobiia bacterium]
MVAPNPLEVGVLFGRAFGVSLVAHVVGNWAQPDFPSLVGATNLLVGLAGLALTMWPHRPLLLFASLLTVISVLAEMPFTGNHWVLAALASLSILATGGRAPQFSPALRSIFIVFYSFAAFSKLNSGFFDPSVSCAIFYADQSLGGIGLGPIPGSHLLRSVVIWATAGVELFVVPLFLIRRTRYAGMVLATTFHVLISFDLSQHFYDFTAVLIALLVWFLPDASANEIARPVSARWRSIGRVGWLGLGVLLVVLANLPVTLLTLAILETVPFVLWIPASLFWLYRVFRAWLPGTPLVWRTGWLAGAVVVLAVLNGLTPYTEIKTGYGFNMYANLVTAQGRSNHIFISHTLPLRSGYEGPVEIIQSSDPGLNLYRQHGYLIAYPQLQRYVAGSAITVEYRRNGEVKSLRGSDLEPGPVWWRFFPLRALDIESPPRCQDVFLPAL